MGEQRVYSKAHNRGNERSSGGVFSPLARVGMVVAMGAGLLVATAVTLSTAPPAAADPTTTFIPNAAGTCQTYTVPDNVNQIDVTLTGGAGAPGAGPGSPGGRGGSVTARLNVESGQVLYGVVGGAAGVSSGGSDSRINEGGGSRAHGGAGGDVEFDSGTFGGTSYGGGGGGTSFLSTDNAHCGTNGADVNGNDVLAVAGGGGGGGSEDAQGDDGGTGGDAGNAGGGTQSCFLGCSAGGAGGSPGTSSGGGSAGNPELGDGGNGGWLGNAPSGSGTNWLYQDGGTTQTGGDFGGGGGGGWFGGGQGGDASDSYGGGGGGSNYVQSGAQSAGTAPTLGVDTTGTPKITITPAPTRRLTVAIGTAGTGTGSVTSGDPSINCGTTCTGYYPTGTSVTLTAHAPAGNRFVGWTSGGALNPSYTLAGSTTLSARWTPNATDDISFNSEGGSLAADLIGFDGTTLPLPLPSVLTGSHFAGWFAAPSGGTALTSPYTLTGSTTLYAHWTSSTVDFVNFDSDGRSAVSQVIGPDGSAVTLPAAPTFPGHTFTGWFTATTGGTALTSPYTLTGPTTLLGTEIGQTDLYAQWTTNATDTISFDAQGGSATSPVSGLEGTTVILPVPPTLAGSTFLGWFTASTGGTVVTSPYTLSGSTTLYAQFAAGTATDTVTFDSSGGSAVPWVSGIQSSTVTLPAPPTYTGFTFAGWFAAPAGCSGTATTCTLTMSQAQSVTATFNALRQLTLQTDNESPFGNGTITANPPGFPCGAGCINFDEGTTVTLTEAPDTSSVFLGWFNSPTCANAATTCTIYMADRDLRYFTSFQQDVLSVQKQGAGTGTITGSVNGVPCATDCSGTLYPLGTVVNLTVTADPGSTAQWASFPCVDNSPTCAITMNGSTSVLATFTKNPETLSVDIAGGLGSVSSSPAGISCASQSGCAATSHIYDQFSTVTLTATPQSGTPFNNSTFSGWSGACTNTTGPCTVAMNAAESVTANFTPIPQYALSVTSPLGSGSGTVTSADGDINCGEFCLESNYYANTVVTLTEAPDTTTSTFAGWSGACSGMATTCTVTMSQAQNVGATFTLLPEQLTVATNGTGSGTVTSEFVQVGPFPQDVTINCPTECTGTYAFNAEATVTLDANPAANAIFTGWSGDCSGTGACQVTMGQARSVTATFTRNVRTLTVATTGAGGGTVTSDLSGTDGNPIDCGTGGSDCSENYDFNTNVVLTATPRTADSHFIGWSGACTNTSGPCNANLTSAMSATANFGLNTLTVNKAGGGGGTISSGDLSINCGTTCVQNYPAGTNVVLTATPNGTSTFTGWSAPCIGTGTCTISVTGARSVTATFTTTPSIQLDLAGSGADNGDVFDATGAINCGSGGTKCLSTFSPGQSVTLNSSVLGGSSTTFDGWSGACTGTGPSCTFTPTDAVTVIATFTLHTNALTVTTAGTGGGTVTSTPTGISCAGSSVCSADFGIDDNVSLAAVADANSTFTGWSGDCSGQSNCSLADMSVAHAVTATFTAKPTFTLTVGTTGTGSATITTDVGGINCPTTCSASFQSGTLVVITATPGTETTFNGFTGIPGCIPFNGGQSNQCEIQMNSNITAHANLTLSTMFMFVSFSGTGAGSVTSSAGGIPNNINCASPGDGGSDCGDSFATNSTVTLTAVAGANSTFTNWDGFACQNAGSEPANVCQVLMNGFETPTAVFTHAPVAVHLRADGGTGTGTVTVAGSGGVNCAFRCTVDYPYNTGAEAFLTATPDTDMQFMGWSTCQGSKGANECILTPSTTDLSATAVFEPVTQVLTLAISTAGSGSGTGSVTINSDAGLVTCTSSCTTNVNQDSTVTLTAFAGPTGTFDSWAGSPCGSDPICTVTVVPNAPVFETARFDGVPVSLYVSQSGDGTGTVNSDVGGINCGASCSTTQPYGSFVRLFANPSAPNVFAGWSGACTNQTGSCLVDLAQTQFVTATFTPPAPLHTVTFDPNGGTGGTMADETGNAPTALTTNGFTWPGFTFTGWNTAAPGDGTPYADSATYGFDADTTLFAQWSANATDTITFDAQGGSAVDPVSGPDGTTITLPDAPTLAANTFDGWFAAPSGGTALTSPYTVVGSTTLYAQWSPTIDTITFDAQGGSAVDPVSGPDGTTISLPDAPTLAGSTFDGWFAAPSGGVAFTSPYTLAGSTTLYAQWSGNATDTVTFDAQGGSAVDPVSGPDGTTISLPDAPTLAANTFDGWFAAPSGGTALTSPYTLAGSTTLYAQWSPIGTTDTITFDAQGGSAADPVSGPDGTTITLPDAPTLAGSTFDGWFAAPIGGVALTSPYTLAGSTTLYAQWTANLLYPKITFRPHDQTLAQSPLTVSATSLSGLPMTFITKTPHVCTTSGPDGATITLLDTGTCTVVATQSGNATYAPESVKQSFTVSKAPQRITFRKPFDKTLAQSPLTVSATVSSGLGVTFATWTPQVCTAGGPDGAVITLLKAGTCTVAAHVSGNATYDPAPAVTQSFTVSKVDQKITFKRPFNRTVSRSTETVSATASSGLTVTFATRTPLVCTAGGPDGAVITFLMAGTCTVAARQSGNATYDPATPLPQSFTLLK